MIAPTAVASHRLRRRDVARTLGAAIRGLRPTHFVLAVGLAFAAKALLAVMFMPLALGSNPDPPADSTLPFFIGHAATFGLMAAALSLDRRGSVRIAFAALGAGYLALLYTGTRVPSASREFWNVLIMVHALLFATLAADRAVASGLAHRRAYLTAALAGALLGALLQAMLFNFGPAIFRDMHRQMLGTHNYFVTHPIFLAAQWLLFGGGAVFFYGERRGAQLTLQRLRSAELERVTRSREVLESRLQVMQARVEPQFLFNTLAQVRELYGEDVDLAERMLDELVAYLRAAMPHMRDSASTVAREVELVRAYLAIVQLRLGGRLAYAIDVADDVGDARIAPMVLLPLVDHAVVHGFEAPDAKGTIAVEVEVVAGRLRLVVRDTGAGFVIDDPARGLDVIRERLAALYGAESRLTIVPLGDGEGTQALMEIPYSDPVAEEEHTAA